MKRRPHHAEHKPSTKSDAQGSTKPLPQSSGPSHWLFPALALTLAPLLCLGALELGLRIGGYGYATSFFLPLKSDGQKSFVENDKFARRFFPRQLARRPLPLRLNATKPRNTFRVFVLGESAAMGDPDPAFGFSRILEVLLRERFPEARFEVVNVAFTAINSHVILPIARECAGKEGDLWIVYLGNNEVMGPFGAGTIFNAQSPPLPVIRGNLALKRLKTGQLVDAGVDWLVRSGSATQSWAGMEMFLNQQIPRDDARLDRVYAHFKRNLADILRVGRSHGAKIILCSVTSNLKDCAPFASAHAPGLSQAQLAEWNKAYHEAVALESAGVFDQAIPRYLAAEQIDPVFAELQYRLGRCYLAQNEATQAQHKFALARDLDTLRFRADTRLNEIIKTIGLEQSKGEIFHLDTLELFQQSSTNGVPGNKFFFDHVHFTFEGNYLLARALAERAASTLAQPLRQKDNGAWASADQCARRLALTGWSRYQMYDLMRRRLAVAPFTNQANHLARQQSFQAKLAELRPSLQSGGLEAARQIFEEALSLFPSDPLLNENYAKLLKAGGDVEAAITRFQRVSELLPHSATASYNVGLLLSSQGKSVEAGPFFLRALRQNADLAEAHNGLGAALVQQGRVPEAIARFTQALQIRPDFAEAHLNMGLALQRQGHTEAAGASFTQALRLNPDSYTAHLNLGNLLLDRGHALDAMPHYSDAVKLQPEIALADFRETVRVQPNNPAAHLRLANALAVLNRREEALESLRESVRLNTNFWEARYLLGIEMATLGKLPEAMEQFAQVLRLRPNYARAHLNLGVALARQSKLAEAAVHFQAALRLDPTNNMARQYLQTLQSMTNSAR